MPGYWFGGFSAIRMIAGGLIWLGFLALIVLGVIALLRGLIRPSQPVVTPVLANPPAPAAAHACPNCVRPVQADWIHCPYCGSALPENLSGDMPQA
jgi:hypothetical protein